MKQRADRGHAGSTAPRLYTPCLWWRVSVVMLVVLTPALGAGGGHQVLRGRCYSYCMKRHLLQPASPSGDVDPESLPKNPIRACQRHHNCRWCLYVCERPEDNFTNSTACLRDCRYTRTRPRSGGRQACTEACGFVGRASSARGGTCPAPLSLNGFQSACVTSCHRDRDCHRAEEKCCSNNCGAVCTQPYDVHILPPVPTNISFKMLKTGGVMIKWRLDGGAAERDGSGSAGDRTRGAVWGDSPVVYILRWWCPYTSGAVTSVTDRSRTKLQGYPTGIYPGSKCHFMVAAVNVYGSRGFSRVSPYIKKFLTPSPPLHLEQVRTRVHNDGQVDVIIQWQPPVYTDGLPIFRYQVFWSDHLPQASPNYMRFHMYRRVLDADKTTFVLQSLRPGTLYFVQVRAVVRWKGRQKRGELASAYIETYSPPQPYVPRAEDNGGGGGSGEEGDADSSIIQSVSVNQTFYHDTILKASLSWTLKPDTSARKYLIYWRAETCARSDHRKLHRRLETSATSHDLRFLLYNLQPECEYAVRVHPVNKRGRTGAATVTNFVTPPCHQAEVRQGEPPICHTAEPPEQVKGLHSETSRCVTVIRWELPSSGADDVESYDVMWGETTAGAFTTSTIIYTSDPQEMSVPANVSEVELGQLTSGQHYSVQVRARSAGGTGSPAILHLTVPHPDRPCDRRSPQAGARSPDNENKQHGNHSVTPSKSRTDDADDTSYLNGSASRNPTLSPNKTQSSDVTSNRTGDVSIDLDVIDKFGNSEERGDGGGVSVDSGKGVSEEGELGISSGAPSPSASTKDVRDSASRRDNGTDPGGVHSQHGKDSVGNVSDSGRDSDGVAFRTQGVNTTLPTDLTMDTTVGTAGSVTARSPTNTSGPAGTGAGGTSKASLSLTLFMSCLLLLYVCVRT